MNSNIACVYAGLKLVETLCRAFDQPWDNIFPIPLKTCVGHIVYAVKEYLLDGGTSNVSIIGRTFEVMARMRLKADVDFFFEVAGRHLCIALNDVYDRHTKYRGDYRVVGEVLSYEDFTKQLKHSEYFVAGSKVVKKGRKIGKRFWTVDFEKLQQNCDVSGFLVSDAEDE